MRFLSDAHSFKVALVAFAALVLMGQGLVFAQSDTIQTNVPALKNVFAHDFRIGCLLSYRHIGFPDDPYVPGQSAVAFPYGGYLIKYHMNGMSPGNNMKAIYTLDINSSAAAYTAATTPEAKDSIETHPIIRFNGDIIAQLNWARRQGFSFRGHTLVWHGSQTPAAFFRSGYITNGARLTKEKMTARMENYIKEVIRTVHEGWPGLLLAFDVVNEAVTDAGADRTTDSEWYLTFGDNSYIMKAFEFARKYTVLYGETQIKLYYNDYNTSIPAKANKIAQVCSPIFRAGYLDGIGMQEHDGTTSPTAEAWIASYNKFDTVCTEMAVTELDVKPARTPLNDSLLVIQANQYGQLFKCFVERSYFSGRGKIINVSKDGLNDSSAFVAYASLWDTHNKCKRAFFAAVGVGINYNALDSLIHYAETLEESRFTTQSWASFVSTLTSARSARDRNYSFTVSADTALGNARDSLQTAINNLVVTGIDEADNTAKVFALSQNYPNPFNPVTVIKYTVGVASGRGQVASVRLVVYDLLGREVAALVNEQKAPGAYETTFDASGLASGIYIYRLTAGSFVQSKSMVLVK
jgi:GH35 family endo-1,4-beta-xylanase